MITPKRRSSQSGKAGRKRIGNPALRAAKYKRLLASGAKTNKGTWHEFQMFSAYARDMGKVGDEKIMQRRMPQTRISNAERAKLDTALRRLQGRAARRHAKIKRISILEELRSVKRHIGLPTELIHELALEIFYAGVSMENVYKYYKKRKELQPGIKDSEVWADYLAALRRRNSELTK
ncbi:MAG: hypothetical protein PHD95_05835 [Candidatus ainarchaeum sp.]|nr:hypothetical protein [Candidatus ainarchaeum sp.]